MWRAKIRVCGGEGWDGAGGGIEAKTKKNREDLALRQCVCDPGGRFGSVGSTVRSV